MPVVGGKAPVVSGEGREGMEDSRDIGVRY